MTRVVNLRKEPFDVYIGRPGKGLDGYFGNPVVVHEECPVCGSIHSSRGETLPCFASYAFERVQVDDEFRQRLIELRGKTLGCFCKPAACHGDVMVDLIVTLAGEELNVA